jgi:hypothetical protein
MMNWKRERCHEYRVNFSAVSSQLRHDAFKVHIIELCKIGSGRIHHESDGKAERSNRCAVN